MIEENQITIAWLAFGVFLFATELGVPGVGLMFAGCGALTVGMLLNFEIIPYKDFLLQATIFLGASAIWTAILWNPLKKLRLGKKKVSYSNMIGQTAIVGEEGITRLHGGNVLWSGTIMKAVIADNYAVDNIASGASVKIEDVMGNILIISPQL